MNALKEQWDDNIGNTDVNRERGGHQSPSYLSRSGHFIDPTPIRRSRNPKHGEKIIPRGLWMSRYH
jgi:hypothetical protein